MAARQVQRDRRRGNEFAPPPRIYEALKKWSADELRSVNGQIEFLLLDALKRADRWKKPAE